MIWLVDGGYVVGCDLRTHSIYGVGVVWVFGKLRREYN